MASVVICVEVSTESDIGDEARFREAVREHIENELSAFQVDYTEEDFYGNETEVSADCDGGSPWISNEEDS